MPGSAAKTTGDKNRKDNKLFIVYRIGPEDPKLSTNELFTLPNFFEFDTENYTGFDTALKKYKEMLLNQKIIKQIVVVVLRVVVAGLVVVVAGRLVVDGIVVAGRVAVPLL